MYRNYGEERPRIHAQLPLFEKLGMLRSTSIPVMYDQVPTLSLC